jgi:hypothetical protein
MRTTTFVLRLFSAGAVLVGSFFGALPFIDYRAQQSDTQLVLDGANERSTRSTLGVTMLVNPPSLPECGGPRVAKIFWNASAAVPRDGYTSKQITDVSVRSDIC